MVVISCHARSHTSPYTGAVSDHPVPQAAGNFMLDREIPVWTTAWKTVRNLVWLLFILLLLQRVPPARAQELTLKQMDHTAWTAKDGAPMGVNSIAEAGNGTLWLATRGGLFNFDGL